VQVLITKPIGSAHVWEAAAFVLLVVFDACAEPEQKSHLVECQRAGWMNNRKQCAQTSNSKDEF